MHEFHKKEKQKRKKEGGNQRSTINKDILKSFSFPIENKMCMVKDQEVVSAEKLWVIVGFLISWGGKQYKIK